MKRLLFATLALLPGALFIATLASAQPSERPVFVELGDFLWSRQDPEAHRDRGLYSSLQQKVRQDFDALCGDTWCEGDIMNWQLLTLECSIRMDQSRVRECHLVVAGSEQSLNSSTGTFEVSRREVVDCRVELDLPLEKFLKLKGLETEFRLPRGPMTSFYRELTRCMP